MQWGLFDPFFDGFAWINPYVRGSVISLGVSDLVGLLGSLATQSSQIPRARDPNELTGPAGYGSNNFVRADSLLPYTIHFENETNATAPAQRVVITDRLTNRLVGPRLS